MSEKLKKEHLQNKTRKVGGGVALEREATETDSKGLYWELKFWKKLASKSCLRVQQGKYLLQMKQEGELYHNQNCWSWFLSDW